MNQPVSIPGVPGLVYDTSARSTFLSIAMTAAGRRAPKPHGYALQVLPYLLAVDVDVREIPADHPLQYLHPESAPSIDRLAADEADVAYLKEVDALARAAWDVRTRTEESIDRRFGLDEDRGTPIEIEDASE